MGFFSRESGQKRRAWLDSVNAQIGEAARYYMGPGFSDAGASLVNALGYMNPVNDIGEAMAAGRDGEYINMLAHTATAAAPVVAGKIAKAYNPRMSDDAAQWLEDALMGVSVNPTAASLKAAPGQFVGDERGALRLHRVDDYKGAHTAPVIEEGATMHDVSNIYGDDVYSHGLRYFGTGDEISDVESLQAMMKVRGKPGGSVWVYRAVPKDAPNEIGPGDWVTPSKTYATQHGESHLGGDYKVVREMVSARELSTDGNSLNEWGWWPSEKRLKAAAVPQLTPQEEAEIRAYLGE